MSTQAIPIVQPSHQTPSPISPPPGSLIGKKAIPVTTDWGAQGLVVGDPVHANPNNPQFTPPHVTICSVFPAVLATPFMAFRCVGYPQFILPAPPSTPNGFSCLRVYDTVAVVADTNKIEDRDWNGADAQTVRSVPALDPSGNGGLAFDIVQKFAGSMIGANPLRQLGVGIIKGDLPTAEEIAHLHRIQNALFVYYVNDADELAQKGESNKISAFHRFSLEQLGDFDPIRHPWHKEIRRQAMKSCFACGKLIAAAATTCSECHQDLVLLAFTRWERMGRLMLTQEQDPVVYPLVAEAVERSAQVAQAGAGARTQAGAPRTQAPPAQPKE